MNVIIGLIVGGLIAKLALHLWRHRAKTAVVVDHPRSLSRHEENPRFDGYSVTGARNARLVLTAIPADESASLYDLAARTGLDVIDVRHALAILELGAVIDSEPAPPPEGWECLCPDGPHTFHSLERLWFRRVP